MTPFTYTRVPNAEIAVRDGGMAGAKYLGGGTNLVDLMREGIEHPKTLVDVTALSSTIEDARGRRASHRRRNHQHRTRIRSTGAGTLSRACPRDSGGCVGANPQHGDRRRQHPAADALRLFL